jgi:excisionase family DNA binding protein
MDHCLEGFIMVVAVKDIGDLLPTEHDAELARESSRVLSNYARRAESLRLELSDDGHHEAIYLPAGAVRLLLDLLTQMAKGNAVTLLPMHAELTTQQAADILNVSRPYFVKLLDTGVVGHRKVGTHRRVLLRDVIAYKREVDTNRAQALEELTRQAEDQGMGY